VRIVLSAGDGETCAYCLMQDGLAADDDHTNHTPPFMGCLSDDGCRCVVIDVNEIPVEE